MKFTENFIWLIKNLGFDCNGHIGGCNEIGYTEYYCGRIVIKIFDEIK